MQEKTNQLCEQMFVSTVKFEQSDIWVKPVCDLFKINYENQVRKIKSDPILANQSTKKSNSLMFKDNYPRILLTKKGFIRWIQILNPNIIAEELQPNFLIYQEMVFDYLYGSPEEEQDMRTHYNRLTKLEKLQIRVATEIKRVKFIIKSFNDKRYLQASISFPEQKKLD